MFCVLNFEERKKRLFHNNPPYYAVKTVIPKTAVFERLTVYSYRNKTDFYAVREHLKSFSKSVVLAENCVLPSESGLFEFSSNSLKSCMTFNSALYLLDGVKNKRRMSLTLIDRTGEFSSLLEKTVSLAGTISVFTSDELRYRYCADEIYDNYGAVVTVNGWNNQKAESDVVITLSSGGKYPISVTVKSRAENRYISFEGDDFTLPEDIGKYKPSNIENYPFASALFCLSGIKRLGKMKYDTFTVNSRTVTLDSAAKMLDTLLNF